MLHQPNNPPASSWDRLASTSLMPSACHSRTWLEPMFEHFRHHNAKLITPDNTPLQAVASLDHVTLPGGIRLPIAQTWDNGYLFSGTPLISADNPQAALVNLLSAARSQMNVGAVLFRKVQRHEIFEQILQQVHKQSDIAGFRLFNSHQRAALQCHHEFDHWFNENFSRKRRKEYRRLRNRFAETGNLQSLTWQPCDPVEQWIEEFLLLEAAGWKGRHGTAIASNSEQTAQLRHALPQMAQNGSLLFWKITLDDKPVASMFGFLEQDQVWLGKMAYDETLSQFSPGVLVILDATRDLLTRKDITLADSSADPDHPMINNIWRDRLPVADYLIATPGTSQTKFKALTTLYSARLQARQLAKTAYHKIRKGLKK